MGFAQPFVGPGIHGVREVVCVLEAAGKITKFWLHRVCYVTPAFEILKCPVCVCVQRI